MESFITQLSLFFRWLLVCSMQVSVVVCLIVAIKAAMSRRLAIRWHYWLWLLLLVRMIMPWAPESSFSVFTLVTHAKKAIAAEEAVRVTPAVRTADVTAKRTRDATLKTTLPHETPEPAKPVRTKHRPTQASANAGSLSLEVVDMLALGWLAVALCLAVFALVWNFRLWRIIKFRRPLTEGKVLDLLEDCKAQMGVRTILGVVVTDKLKSPALFGVVRPRLLLPEGTLESLSTEELRYVFLHELGHLKRRDIYLGWLMVILQVLHWFNPLVWFAFGRMRADRELACDGLVLSTMAADESQAYGRTLVNLFKGFSGLQYAPGIAGILENKSQLKRRITMIARFKKGSYRWSVLAVVLLAVLACVALTNARGTTQAENKEPTALAKELVRLLVEERFSVVTKNFDATMKAALPAEKLEEAWKATTGQAGLFNRQLGVRTEKYLSYDIVLVTCEFEKGPLDVKVVYNEKGEVSGLFFIPTPVDVLKNYEKQTLRPKPRKRKVGEPSRGSVTFVLGENGRMTFEGQKTTLAELSSLLARVPDRPNTYLAFAVDTRSLPESKVEPVKGKLIKLSHELGFKYFSFIGEHPLGSYSLSRSRFGERLRNNVTVDIKHSPNNKPLTVQYAVIAICKDAGIPYQWEKSAKLADPQRRNFIEPVHIENVTLEKALIDVLSPVGLRYDLDKNGLYLYRPAKQKGFRGVGVKKTRTANVTKGRKQGKRVELSYDDGSSEGKKSIAGSGHALIFEAPAEGCVLKAVRIYGSRYGYPRPPKEDFHIWRRCPNRSWRFEWPLQFS